MDAKLRRRLLVAWIVVSAATLVYLGLDSSVDRNGILRPSAAVTAGVIVIALVKVRIIFREFMEVRRAPVWLTRLTDIWVVVLGLSLIASYLIGRTMT